MIGGRHPNGSLTLVAIVLAGCTIAGCASSGDAPKATVAEDPAAAIATAGTAVPQPQSSGVPASLDPNTFAVPGDGKVRELVVAPIPIVNPTIGNGLALGGAMVFPSRRKVENEPTILGGGGFYTDSRSWGVATGFKTSLRGDKIRALGVIGAADVHYDYYGIGGAAAESRDPIPLDANVRGAAGEFLYALRGNVFAGLSLSYGNTRTALAEEQVRIIDIPAKELDATLASLGLRAQWDERDNSFYPKEGMLFNFKGQFFDEALSSDFTYQKYTIAYNHYMAAGERSVVAVRGSGCLTTGQVPFFDLCLFGTQSDLRGYDGGQYRDKAMFATQAEWRRELPKRFGVVVFAGFGEVMPAFSGANLDGLLPAAGVGLRWTAARQNHINLRIDYAVGKASRALYVSVGEAF